MKLKSKLSLEPQMVSRTTWYYEERGGILVVHETRDKNGGFIQTDQFRIPWRKLVASLRRRGSKE